jgi:hypothetical protein
LLGEDKNTIIGLSNPFSLSFFLSIFLALVSHCAYPFLAFLQVVATFEVSFFFVSSFIFLFFIFYFLFGSEMFLLFTFVFLFIWMLVKV